MERESDGSGWRVTLRVTGAARFLVVGFLSFWLCGWAVGELFAGGTFLAGLRDLVAPDLELPWLPHMKNRAPSNPWPILGFLAVWLTGWTVGGAAAAWQALRALAGVDDVRWDHEGLEVVQRAGPFASRRREAWSNVSELLVRRRAQLVAQTRRGLWLVTGMGTHEDRQELGAALVSAWREARGPDHERRESAGKTPEGWAEAMAEDGRTMLVSDPRPRRVGAWIGGLVAAGLVAAAVAVAANASGAGAWTAVVVLSLFASAAAPAAAWLAFGRVELRPSHGALRRVRRFLGREWAVDFAPARLQLESARDSDGDERWSLVVRGSSVRATLAHDLHVPGAARHMGLWLSHRMDVPLEGQPDLDEDALRTA